MLRVDVLAVPVRAGRPPPAVHRRRPPPARRRPARAAASAPAAAGDAAEQLVEEADRAGGRDNATAVVVEVGVTAVTVTPTADARDWRRAPGSSPGGRRRCCSSPDRDRRAASTRSARSAHGGELQALASATVAAGFDVGPVRRPRRGPATSRVMAFGDVAVETDQPSLPMLSGAGSRTWVEHTLPLVERGRRATRAPATTSTPATDLAGRTSPLAGGVPRSSCSPPAAAPTRDPPGEPPAADVRRRRPPVARRPAPSPRWPSPDASARPPSEPRRPGRSDALPPPASEALLADELRPRADGRGSLVDAKLCANGPRQPADGGDVRRVRRAPGARQRRLSSTCRGRASGGCSSTTASSSSSTRSC